MFKLNSRRAVNAVFVVAVLATGAARGQSAGNTLPPESAGSGAGGGEGEMYQPNGLMDRSPHERHTQLTLWAVLPYYDGFGIGAGGRISLPIVKDGFIDAINDSIELEFGADIAYAAYYFYGNGAELFIPIEARWTFHFTPKWEAYAKIGLGLFLGFNHYTNLFGTDPGSPTTALGVYPEFTVGGMYRFSKSVALRGELGYPGIKLGLMFDL